MFRTLPKLLGIRRSRVDLCIAFNITLAKTSLANQDNRRYLPPPPPPSPPPKKKEKKKKTSVQGKITDCYEN